MFFPPSADKTDKFSKHRITSHGLDYLALLVQKDLQPSLAEPGRDRAMSLVECRLAHPHRGDLAQLRSPTQTIKVKGGQLGNQQIGPRPSIQIQFQRVAGGLAVQEANLAPNAGGIESRHGGLDLSCSSRQGIISQTAELLDW
jgi:hypothetical protein